MSKVTGPLLSIAASGSVAGLLTFRNTRSGFVVQQKCTDLGPPSFWQLIERQTMIDAAAAWQALPPQTRAIWGNSAIPTSRSGWQSFFLEWKAQRITAGNYPLIPSQYIGREP